MSVNFTAIESHVRVDHTIVWFTAAGVLTLLFLARCYVPTAEADIPRSSSQKVVAIKNSFLYAVEKGSIDKVQRFLNRNAFGGEVIAEAFAIAEAHEQDAVVALLNNSLATYVLK
jgi:hypothetical protein